MGGALKKRRGLYFYPSGLVDLLYGKAGKINHCRYGLEHLKLQNVVKGVGEGCKIIVRLWWVALGS